MARRVSLQDLVNQQSSSTSCRSQLQAAPSPAHTLQRHNSVPRAQVGIVVAQSDWIWAAHVASAATLRVTLAITGRKGVSDSEHCKQSHERSLISETQPLRTA